MTNSPQHYTSTDSLTRPRKTRFYPLDIPVLHPQLRHFISTVEQDWIYFASHYDICGLHLPSQRRYLLVTLPFSPRCLAAGLGWICAGGEHNGDAAFIRLRKDESDTRFKANEETPRRTLPDLGKNNVGLNSYPELVVNELGGEIVNSITLHELSNKGNSDWNEPVALLSNNDKTVKIYSLLLQQIIADIQHPFPINYALISPDSDVLVAVGDAGQAYFYRRRLAKPIGPSQDRFARYEWEIMAKPKLARGGRTIDDHSFSVTFSPSGHLCAISAQGGMISVFDMDMIKTLADDNVGCCSGAMICSFNSSRSGLYGCVRSMAFSPAPWDLLAWAEDRGRAGIADVRQAFCRRQIIVLEKYAADLEMITLEDMTDPYIRGLDIRGRLIRQYQENFHSENTSTGGESMLGAPEDWSDGASLQRQEPRRTGLADLDAREQSVLDTLEVTMEEFDDALNNVPHPYSVNYRPSHHPRTSLESDEQSPSRAHLESLIDVFRERNGQRIHGDHRQYLPRRRNSIALSQGAGSATERQSRLTPGSITRSRITASPSRMAEAEGESHSSGLRPSTSTSNLTPTSEGSETQIRSHHIPSSDPWHVIQSALDSSHRTDAVPTASRLTPPSSNHGGDDAADGGVTSHLPSQEAHSTERTSTRASTLPTAVNSTQPQPISRLHSQQNPLRRSPPLSEVETERQSRRLTSTTADLGSREGQVRPRAHADDEPHIRILEARIQARQRLAAREPEQASSSARTISRMSALQRSELTPADLRLARQMLMQSARTMVDRNGNWTSGVVIERLLGRSNVGDASGLGAGAVAREGVGTAGVGWSVDGRHLFVGTEEGIFEYAVNLTDRRVFPALGLR